MGDFKYSHAPSHGGGANMVVVALVGLGLLAAIGFFLVSWLTFREVAVPKERVVDHYQVAQPGQVNVLVVEVEQDGQFLVNGQRRSLEELEDQFRQARALGVPVTPPQVYVVDGTPIVHLQKIQERFRTMGFAEPQLITVPPRRRVTVQVDAQGNPTIDGQATPEIQSALEGIAKEHRDRVTVVVRADPQCPADAVIQLMNLCKQLGFGGIEWTTQPAGDRPE